MAAGMFSIYHPRAFCRDYVDLKGHSGQLVNFMAAVLGFKPLMDDWIAPEHLAAYQDICRGYGLHVKADAIFLPRGRSEIPADVVGRDTLTSTCAYGAPAEAGPIPGGQLHVFVARDPSLLRHGMWYPLIVGDRVIWPPRVDVLKYGRVLGYPPCCTEFFRRCNDWTKFSFLWEIRRRSGRLHPWCNPLAKDLTYSYIYHMPCTFACEATIRHVAGLRAAIQEREPELVAAIDRALGLPVLVFRERRLYFFRGRLLPNGERIEFDAWVPDGSEPGPDGFEDAMRGADAVEVHGPEVRVLKGTEVRWTGRCRPDGFAPEIPFLIQFPLSEQAAL